MCQLYFNTQKKKIIWDKFNKAPFWPNRNGHQFGSYFFSYFFFWSSHAFSLCYSTAPPKEDCTSVTHLPNAFEGPITISTYLFWPWWSIPLLGKGIRCTFCVSYLHRRAVISPRLGTLAVIHCPFPLACSGLKLQFGRPQHIVPQTAVIWKLLSLFWASLCRHHNHLPGVFHLIDPFFST